MTISIEAVIEAPLPDTWAMISDFANLQRWHPLVQRCETQGHGERAIRTVYFADSWAAERLDRLDHDGHVLQYDIIGSDKPSSIGLKGVIALSADGEGRTSLKWTSGVDPKREDAASLDSYLEQYYLTRINHLREALKAAQV